MSKVILVTEDDKKHKRSISTTVQELWDDWNNECVIAPENAANVYFMSIDDEIVVSEPCRFDHVMTTIIEPRLHKRLKISPTLYLPLLDGETKDEAVMRLEHILRLAGLDVLGSTLNADQAEIC